MRVAMDKTAEVDVVGRYALHAPIAKGGMAVVHLARILGPEGFSRIVAAKRLFPHFAADAEFVSMFLDEARIASKIHHPNVVPVLDVVMADGEVVLIQEYVHGVPLDKLCKATWALGERVPIDIAVAIVVGALAGLGAAHDATDEFGEPLHIVHRDVSPQNIMVSVDGVPRVLDFGIAKARSSSHVTREGVFKGKIAYVAPEQLRGAAVTHRADVYSAGVVLWELLAGRKLFPSENMDAIQMMAAVIEGAVPPLRRVLAAEWTRLPTDQRRALEALEPVVVRALSFDAENRYATADALLAALTEAVRPASAAEVAAWVRERGREFLDAKQRAIAESEEVSRRLRLSLDASVDSAARIVVSGSVPVVAPPDVSFPPSASTMAPESERPSVAGVRRRPFAIAAITVLAVAVTGASAWIAASGGDAATRAAASTGGGGQMPGVSASVVSPSVVSALAASPSGTTATAQPAAGAPATGHEAAPTMTLELSDDEPTSQDKRSEPRPEPKAAAPAPPATYTPPARPSPMPRPKAPERPRSTRDRGASENRSTEPAPPAAAPPAAAPAPASTAPDCNPPYYLEGTKKVYKPGCL